jgi:hypothetical protein
VLIKHFVVVCCFLFFSNSLSAKLIQWDAFNVGDELAVKDESTGLIWLDLNLTAGVHFDQAGSLFAGWGYADYRNVESLLEETFVDINISGVLGNQYLYEQNCANTTSCYSSARSWQELFGSTVGSESYQTHSFGLYQDELGVLRMGGTYVNGSGSANRYSVEYTGDYSSHKYLDNSINYYSTFLIKIESLPIVAAQYSVSEPTTKYFLALVLGCMWIGRRKLTS